MSEKIRKIENYDNYFDTVISQNLSNKKNLKINLFFIIIVSGLIQI